LADALRALALVDRAAKTGTADAADELFTVILGLT
jgi:hypothetical protein